MMDLPDWAKREESYRPDKDRDAFISRSLLRMMEMLKVLRAQADRRHRGQADMALALLILLLLAVVTARTPAFLWTVLGGELVLMTALTGAQLRQIVMGALTAALFCLLLILPALIFWGTGPAILLPFKTFLCVTALNLLQQYFSWHEITAALADFVECASYLLAPGGAFYLIHRPQRLADIFPLCTGVNLEPKRMRMIVPHAGDSPNLVLLEFRKNGGRELKVMPELAVYSRDGGYTDEVRKIYRISP